MALRLDATLEAFKNKIITNKEVMDILGLPTILKTDDENTIKQKKKLLIDKYITKSSQNPESLSKPVKPLVFDGVKYDKYGKFRIALTLAQSLGMDSYVFGNPQLDIFIYYDNTNMDNLFKLLDLLSDMFVGQNLEIETEEGKSFIRQIQSEGQLSQTAIINNFERTGLRLSFYANLYKI